MPTTSQPPATPTALVQPTPASPEQAQRFQPADHPAKRAMVALPPTTGDGVVVIKGPAVNGSLERAAL